MATRSCISTCAISSRSRRRRGVELWSDAGSGAELPGSARTHAVVKSVCGESTELVRQVASRVWNRGVECPRRCRPRFGSSLRFQSPTGRWRTSTVALGPPASRRACRQTKGALLRNRAKISFCGTASAASGWERRLPLAFALTQKYSSPRRAAATYVNLVWRSGGGCSQPLELREPAVFASGSISLVEVVDEWPEFQSAEDGVVVLSFSLLLLDYCYH